MATGGHRALPRSEGLGPHRIDKPPGNRLTPSAPDVNVSKGKRGWVRNAGPGKGLNVERFAVPTIVHVAILACPDQLERTSECSWWIQT